MSSPRNITIDGDNLIIQFTEIGEIPVKNDVYSEWKEWALEEMNLRYPPAFDTTGGDPLTATENISAYYFIRNDLGWRIKAPELNGQLILVGDLFPKDFTLPFFITSDGAFSNLISQVVSSKSIASFSQADLFALTGNVYIDEVNGVSGIGSGIGTPNNPVDNLADATTIAVANNLRSFVVRGGTTLILTQPYTNWQFLGSGGTTSSTIVLTGLDMMNTRIENMLVVGVGNGQTTMENCAITDVTNLEGGLVRCGLVSAGGSISVSQGGILTVDSCFSPVPGDQAPVISMNGPGSPGTRLSFRNYSGRITLKNMQDGDIASFDLDPGHLVLDPSNAGGQLLYRGTGRVTNNLGSPSPTITDDGFVVASDVTLNRKLTQNRLETDPITGTITLYDDDDTTVLLVASLFEDVAGTQPYRGRGAERRNRLT